VRGMIGRLRSSCLAFKHSESALNVEKVYNDFVSCSKGLVRYHEITNV
jgi:hypothetical protein